jgi:hypothetical protein
VSGVRLDLRADGTQLDYKLIAANIDNVVRCGLW